MECKIAAIKGDGIGPEIVGAAVVCLDAVAARFKHKFSYVYPLLGGVAIDKTGVPLPQETIDACQSCGAVLLGAVGGPKWDSLAGHLRPEKGLLQLIGALGLYASVRPVVLYDSLKNASPLKPSITKKGINLTLIREISSGVYYGARGYRDGRNGQEAYDTMVYAIAEVERIAQLAFTVAMGRRKKVTSIDKANYLETGRLWRATVTKVAQSFPQVEFENMPVNTCATHLLKDPSQFDVILCPNMLGDVLCGTVQMLTGSPGLLPGSNLGDAAPALYSPIHGSAPDKAGLDTANPIATILSAAMMLSSSFNLLQETAVLERAVTNVLAKGFRTADLAEAGGKIVSCSKMAELIAAEVSKC